MPEATHSHREVRWNSSGRLAAVPGRHRDASPPNNLPLQLSSFVGREKQVAEVRRLLKETRLLTLTGSGGCGKTRLALAAAGELSLHDLRRLPEADDRVSLLIQSTPPRTRRDARSVMDRVFFNPEVRPQTTHAIAWRRGDLGGSNGHGNARSVAMVQSVLACGGEARGGRLMSRAGCERALEAHPVGMDQVLGFPVKWGMGYAVGGPLVQAFYGNRFDGRRIAYWGGRLVRDQRPRSTQHRRRQGRVRFAHV
jgi:hypothetical protein